jgi:hypothetical protein
MDKAQIFGGLSTSIHGLVVLQNLVHTHVEDSPIRKIGMKSSLNSAPINVKPQGAKILKGCADEVTLSGLSLLEIWERQ